MDLKKMYQIYVVRNGGEVIYCTLNMWLNGIRNTKINNVESDVKYLDEIESNKTNNIIFKTIFFITSLLRRHINRITRFIKSNAWIGQLKR